MSYRGREVRPARLRAPTGHEPSPRLGPLVRVLGPDHAVAFGAVSVAGPPAHRRVVMHEASLSARRRAPDAESLAGGEALSGGGGPRGDAVERPHAMLPRAS